MDAAGVEPPGASRAVFTAAKALVLRPEAEEQRLGLAILKELGPWESRPLFAQTWELLEELARTVTEPEVLGDVLRCLGWTHSPRALPTLLRFINHRDPRPRGAVANNLVACAPHVNDPTMVAALIRLCDDGDEDVRWSAFYDLAEWVTSDTPEIITCLARRSLDRSPEIRLLAKKMRHKWLRRVRRRQGINGPQGRA